MQKSETRLVNQCTHTSYINPEGASANNIVLKQAIISTTISNLASGKLIMDKLLAEPRQEKAVGQYKKLYSAAAHLFDGDLASAATILNSINGETVVQFAQEMLKAERQMLDKVETDVEEAISTVAKRNGLNQEMATDLRNEINKMRESILSEVRDMFGSGIANFSDLRNIVDRSPRPPISQIGEVIATPTATAALRTLPASVVTLDDIHSELAKKSPESAAYLKINRFFPLSILNPRQTFQETVRLAGYVGVQKYALSQKDQQLKTLGGLMNVEPVGYLHLERLQFTPLGYVRGELVYSLPMLPQEKVRLSHREWSRSEKEFIKLVETSLEKSTEEAIKEKSELAQSSSIQQQHSSAFNASASVSGGFGSVNFSSSVGISATDAETNSRQSSAKTAQEITRTASSRAKQEHKISFRVTTEYELEETSYREIYNPLDRPVRYDFHRLMKKWCVDLYRYDVRLTYDVVVPEPGSYLLRKHIELRNINNELAKPNPFNLSPSMIATEGNSFTHWQYLSREYGVSLEPPPSLVATAYARAEHPFSEEKVGFASVELRLPDDYEFDNAWANTKPIGNRYEDGSWRQIGYIDTRDEYNQSCLKAGAKKNSVYHWSYYWDWSEMEKPQTKGSVLHIEVYAIGRLKTQALQRWQMQCYERLAEAAKAKHEDERQRFIQRRDALIEDLNREDALTLRKIEKEEIMKGVLRWVLGPKFSFYPLNLPQLGLEEGDLDYYSATKDELIKQMLDENSAWLDVGYPGSNNNYTIPTQSVKPGYHEPVIKHGNIIKFLHQAIEWENVIYVLYPYFWTDEFRWDFKQFLYHPDYVHRSFLRAGAARVVLPIRRGYEAAFLSFIHTLSIEEIAEDYPYMTVGEELENMANTQYPYTQSPNKENKKNLVKTWYEFTPTGALDVSEGAVLNEDDDADDNKGDSEGNAQPD